MLINSNGAQLRGLILIFCVYILGSFEVEPLQSPQCEIGFLESTSIEQSGESTAKSVFHGQVRVAFYKEGAKWNAYPCTWSKEVRHPSHLNKFFRETRNWTAVIGGLRNAQVISEAVEAYSSWTDAGIQRLSFIEPQLAESLRHQESISQQSGAGSDGITMFISGETNLSTRIDAVWKKDTSADAIPGEIVELMRMHIQDIDWKLELSKIDKLDRTDLQCADFVQVTHGVLYGLRFTDKSIVDRVGEPDASIYWFACMKDGRKSFIGGGMEYLVSHDVDGDGDQETVFRIAHHDGNGYRIFWNDFEEHSTFKWPVRG